MVQARIALVWTVLRMGGKTLLLLLNYTRIDGDMSISTLQASYHHSCILLQLPLYYYTQARTASALHAENNSVIVGGGVSGLVVANHLFSALVGGDRR
jgi:hypothetical protein